MRRIHFHRAHGDFSSVLLAIAIARERNDQRAAKNAVECRSEKGGKCAEEEHRKASLNVSRSFSAPRSSTRHTSHASQMAS
jgi:hypothetical protein